MAEPAQFSSEAHPVISFCIPTLNRARELDASLRGILQQATTDVEIVIVDGGSTDSTRAVVAEYQQRSSRIRFFDSEHRSGIDRDLLQAVRVARGDYCWLFSDDDILLPGALDNALRVIRQHSPLGLSANYAAFDSQLRHQIATVPAAASGRLRQTTVLRGAAECFSILGIHIGFISCQIVRRRSWQEVVDREDVSSFCNAWIIVYVIGRMLSDAGIWIYLHDICVGYRAGNDSFIARLGVVKRQVITHEHFAHTIGGIFPRGSQSYRAVFRILIRDRMARTLAVQKANGIGLPVQAELFRMYLQRYWSYPSYWVRVFPVFMIPNWCLRIVRKMYFWLKARSAT